MTWRNVDLQKMHRLFYPQVPVVVTAQFGKHVGGMPAIWCMPLSFNPPLVGLAIAPEHETYRLILSAQAFGVNWLTLSHADKVGELGETSGTSYANKLSEVGLTTINGERTSQPLLTEASAVLECLLRERYRTGTHELVIGEVVRAAANKWFDNYWDFTSYDPLLYAGTTSRKPKSWIFKSLKGNNINVALKHPD